MAQQQSGTSPGPIQVQKYLGGLHYPVSKDDILDKAKEEGADKNVLQMLDRIPDREYPSPVEVSREVGKLDD